MTLHDASEPDVTGAADDGAVRLRAGDTEVTVLPEDGCRLSSLRVGDAELLVQGSGSGSFVMAPWCGRTADGVFRNGATSHRLPLNAGRHAIHGTVREQVWQRVDRADDDRSAAFVVDLAEPWPYPGRVTQIIELAEDGSALTMTLGVETAGDSFPAQAGWHPWFVRRLRSDGPEAAVEFSPTGQLVRADGIATTEIGDVRPGPWDDCFTMPDGVDVTLRWGAELELRVTGRDEWVVVYDEQPHAVCVEPQSGPPNGLNTHPRLVTGIEPLETTTTWSWRRPAGPAV
ncbi:aldose epimerase family protein [Streptomyces lonarensis]|uniref:aldose epimerase family protein n=1 Tax=Streptomyces lonarensis TaxID=700599 RepID=UPI0028AB4B7A|nr:aldose 1-epimerase [Streptomyces lonarensis]